MCMMPHAQMDLSIHSRELAEVDTILDRAITAGDPLIATQYGNQLGKTIKLKGIALAKLFFGMRRDWALFRAAGIEEEFGDFVNAHMDITSRTAEKYADMYEAVFEKAPIPVELKNQLATKPMKQLLLLTAAVREGSIGEDELEEVVLKSYDGVREIVREARGEATSSRTAVYARLVQREESRFPKGALVVFGPDGENETIAMFKLPPTTASGQKYLERVKNALGLEDVR
jgi:hypothetical protein